MDPIANMISAINNAILVKKDTLCVPHSIVKEQILNVLKETDFIADYIVNNLKNNKKNIKIFLKYNNNQSSINHLKRVSKPGLRIYCESKKIPRVLGGIGDVIVSTPKGIVSGRVAKKQHVGGEIICEVY